MLAGFGVNGLELRLSKSLPDLHKLPSAVAVAVLLVIVADYMAPGHLKHALPIPPERSRGAPDELLSELSARRLDGRVFNENFGSRYTAVMPYLFGMMNQVFAVPTYEPMIPRAYSDYFGENRLWRGFINVVTPKGLSFGSTAEPKNFPPGGLARLLDLMSVRFYVAHAELSKGRLEELEHFAGGVAKRFGAAHLVERKQALPRVYLVHRAIVLPDARLAWQHLLSPGFAPNQEVVLAQPAIGLEPLLIEGPPERAEIRSYQNDRIAIEARCHASCLLVLTDLDFPGWEARVDGSPVETLRVNTLFRGVRLDPGQHQIEYLYRPRAFRIGAGLTLATLTLLVIAGGYGFARRNSAR